LRRRREPGRCRRKEIPAETVGKQMVINTKPLMMLGLTAPK
jgi:hypothetical protein